jgi:hypothetical protein
VNSDRCLDSVGCTFGLLAETNRDVRGAATILHIEQ